MQAWNDADRKAALMAELEGQSVLSIQPFTDLGSPVELIKSFGGRAQYLGALQVLERELYASV